MPNLGDLIAQSLSRAGDIIFGGIASNPDAWMLVALQFGGLVIVVVLARWLFRHRSRRRAHRR